MPEEMKFEGKIEVYAIQPKAKGDGEFLKLKVSGKTFNLFDMGIYESNKDKLKVGSEVIVTYYDNEWTGQDGIAKTSHVVKEIMFKGGGPTTIKPLDEFKKASEPMQEDSVETIMKNCVRMAMEMTEPHKTKGGEPFFRSENVTAICNSMFIETARRQRL